MTQGILGFIDNLGITPGFALLIGIGFVIGTVVWKIWGPGWIPAEGGDLGRMSVGEFASRVTLHSTQGRLVLWASAGNLALAAAIFLFAIPDRTGIGTVAVFYPLFLFFMHAGYFMKYGSSWFSMGALSTLALFPAWKVLVFENFGLR